MSIIAIHVGSNDIPIWSEMMFSNGQRDLIGVASNLVQYATDLHKRPILELIYGDSQKW